MTGVVMAVFMLLSAWVGWRGGRVREQYRTRRFLEADPDVRRVEITSTSFKVVRAPSRAAAARRLGLLNTKIKRAAIASTPEDYDPVDDPRTWERVKRHADMADRARLIAGIRPHRSPLAECPHCKTVGHTMPDCPIAARLN